MVKNPLTQWETKEKNHGYKRIGAKKLPNLERELGEEKCEIDKVTKEKISQSKKRQERKTGEKDRE